MGSPILHPISDSSAVTFGPPDHTLTLDVVVSRGDLVESRHRVHAAVVDHAGKLLVSARDAGLGVWWRSCAKPFQALPLVEGGFADRLEWRESELALACASHGGEPEHVEIAARMLAGIGLEEGDLACGPHDPLTARGSRLLRESARRPTRLHNNCSGKHAAMLARAVLSEWPTRGYEQHAHPVQQSARESVARWTGVPADRLALGVDGCGVTVFGLPLANMALSYARLVAAARRGDDAPARVVSAMTDQPFLIGGTDRFDTLLMAAGKGRILCKIGAEGVHTLALVDQGIGIALKVEDGAARAQYPAVLAILDALGALPTEMPDALRDLAGRDVRNTRGEVVGETRVSPSDVGTAPANRFHSAPKDRA